jgi:hypothetical protein
MKLPVKGLALMALIIAAPGFAAEADPHAGHHPAPAASTPAEPPKADTPPFMGPQGSMMDRRQGMGMMRGMGEDSAMPMEGYQRMMDHMAAMHGMSPSMMDHMAAMHGMSPSMMAGGSGARPMWEHVDACLDFLKTELKITGAQAKTWEAFASRLRENAAKMRALQSSMQTGKIAEAPLVQRLDHQEKWFATSYENIRALKPALHQLYDSLPQERRKIADMIIPPHLDLMQAM